MHTFAKTPPYSFALSAACARFYSVFGSVRPDGAYRRLARFNGALALVDLKDAGDSRQPAVSAHLIAASGAVDAPAFAERMQRWLNVGQDLTPFLALADADQRLRPTLTLLRGLGTFQLDSLWESLASTLIEQQIALSMAQAAERWLLRTYGDALHHDGETYYAFPTPARIAALTTDDLTPMKITRIRMGRLIAVARLIDSGALDLEALRDQPLEALYEALLRISGVGHWTAAWTIFRATGISLNVGGADVALRAAVNRYIFGLPGRCEVDVMERFFRALVPYDGWAGFFLLTRYALDKY
ncbi:hypothetical protein FBR02_09825 [Anaerolineae bacterium CFX9]|nr:hypothetical protein [Anaerolineae bacterium CFX9]